MTPAGGNDAHPTDGAWRPLDAFVLTGADPAASCPAGFTGFTVRWTTVLKKPKIWDRFYDELVELEAPLRIDLADSAPPKRHREFTAALASGPDLIGFDSAKTPWTTNSLERIDAEAAEDEVGLVLSAHPRHLGINAEGAADDVEVERLKGFLHGSESAVALRMELFDEDLADCLGHQEGFGLFSPGFEFASAYRRGAGALEGAFGLLGPAAAQHALEMLRTDLAGALMLERKLQRFFEGAFHQATRRLKPADRQRALAETFVYFEEEGGGPPAAIAFDDWSALLRAVERLELFPS